MNKQLKTMTVNALLEEISACENEITLNRIKTLADYELQGQDDLTKDVAMKLIYFKQHQISRDTTALTKLLGSEHWCQALDENKVAFYESAVHFLKVIDIPFLTNMLDTQTPYDNETKRKINTAKQALSRFDMQFQHHAIDQKGLIGKEALSITQ